MRNYITAGAVGLLLAAPAPSQAAVSEAEVAELRAQVQALLARVQQLESQAAGAASAPAVASTDAQVQALETRVAGIEAANDLQNDQLAQGAAQDKSMEWASRIKWKGDFRYRHEVIDEEGRDQRNRQRYRARFGLDAKISDSLSAGFQLASGQVSDPRSTNVTLGDSNQRDGLLIDLAYVDWRAFEDGTVTAGKQKYPWHRTGGSLFYDGDVNPEGVAVKWGRKQGLFASAWGLWLSEIGAGADANVVGAQLGWRSDNGLTLTASYHDYGAIQGNSLVFLEYPAGNTTYLGDLSCNLPPPAVAAIRCYANDYNLVNVGVEYVMQVGNLPLSLWGDYIENLEVDELGTGYNLGFKLGKAGAPGSWELGLIYQDVEADAQWAGFLDSDFAGGWTQGKGLLFRGAYVPVKNTSINLELFDNVRNYDTDAERDYQRARIDFSLKF